MSAEGSAASVSEIREMVRAIKNGGSLSSEMDDPIMRLHLAVVRWVNYLGPGDVPDEYQRVREAMSGV